MFTTRDILDIAIRFENNGEAVYRKALKQISNPHMIGILEWIANEEVRHREWFTEMQTRSEAEASPPLTRVTMEVTTPAPLLR